MYNLIKKLGSLVGEKEENSKFQCTFIWKVLLTYLMISIALGLELGMLYSGLTEGFSFPQADFYQAIFFTNVFIAVIFTPRIILIQFGIDTLMKTFIGLGLFIFSLFVFMHYKIFTQKPELKEIIYAIDGILFLYLLLFLNWKFTLIKRTLDKFCKRIPSPG